MGTDCVFSPSVVERWLLNRIQVLSLKLLFSLRTACNLSPTWGPGVSLPFWISEAVPGRGPHPHLAAPSLLRWARDSTVHLPTVSVVSHPALLLELMSGACFSRVDLQGKVASHLDRGCLDALPPVAICSVYAEPWPVSWSGSLRPSLLC